MLRFLSLHHEAIYRQQALPYPLQCRVDYVFSPYQPKNSGRVFNPLI
ncbi:hypothetical protein [Xenorhabdus innexi]|nr:hypothetical protein [Xenorhabdus innexi]